MYSTYFFFSSVLVIPLLLVLFFFFNDTATTEIYTLSLHDALPITSSGATIPCKSRASRPPTVVSERRSEEHTSELQSRPHLVCRLLLETKKTNTTPTMPKKQYNMERPCTTTRHEP